LTFEIWFKFWGTKILSSLKELVKLHQNFRDYSNKLGKSNLNKEIWQPFKLNRGVYNGLDHGGRRVFWDYPFGGDWGQYDRLILGRGMLFLNFLLICFDFQIDCHFF